MAVSETTPQQQPTAPVTPTSLQERRLFNFYRPEDGHASRAVCGLTLGALFLWGAYSFFEWLPQSWKEALPKTQELLGTEFTVSWGLLASAALGIGFLYGIFWLVNYPKWVDFLIETESEMKKVSWASRRQVVTESVVVVITVLILGSYIFCLDSILYAVKALDWDKFLNNLGF